MYIPLEAQAIATTLSTVVTHSPTSVPVHSTPATKLPLTAQESAAVEFPDILGPGPAVAPPHYTSPLPDLPIPSREKRQTTGELFDDIIFPWLNEHQREKRDLTNGEVWDDIIFPWLNGHQREKRDLTNSEVWDDIIFPWLNGHQREKRDLTNGEVWDDIIFPWLNGHQREKRHVINEDEHQTKYQLKDGVITEVIPGDKHQPGKRHVITDDEHQSASLVKRYTNGELWDKIIFPWMRQPEKRLVITDDEHQSASLVKRYTNDELWDKIIFPWMRQSGKRHVITEDEHQSASLVKRYTNGELWDKIIFPWMRQPGKRHVITDDEHQTKFKVVDGVITEVTPDDEHQINFEVNTDDEDQTKFRVIDGVITEVDPDDEDQTNVEVITDDEDQTKFQLIDGVITEVIPDNSTLIPVAPHNVTSVLERIFKLPVPGNLTFPPNSTVSGNSTLLLNSTTSHNLSSVLERIFKLPVPRNWTVPVNSTSHGRLPVRRSLNSARSVMARDDSSAKEDTSLVDTIFSDANNDITEVVQLASLADPEILEIFGQNGDRVKSFLDQPVIRDLIYATSMKHAHGRHHKHGKKVSPWADPKFVSKFIKDSAYGVMNSAQIVDGVAKTVKHKGHSER